VTATVTTATLVPKHKRSFVPTERAVLRRATAADQVEAIAGVILDGTSDSSVPIDSSIVAEISSACSCLNLGPLFTNTVTVTDPPVVRSEIHSGIAVAHDY
jgi:hypothetical protein